MAARAYRVKNVSSVTPIKEIAARCGWNGEKTDRARKFLSDLKALTVAYNDFPTNWVVEEYARFLESEDEVMFVHIREPEEIAKFVSRVPRAITLLIRGGTRFRRAKKEYGNASDDGVEKYRYDYVFYNDAPLDKTEAAFCAFLANVLRERALPSGDA
jgi:hypothetical protein